MKATLSQRAERHLSGIFSPHTRKTLQRLAIEKAKWAAGLLHRRAMFRLRGLSGAELATYQATRLRRMYDDAVAHVPYYRDHPELYPRTLPVDPDDPLDSLRRLPILPKHVVKSQTERFWRVPPLLVTGEHTTGGTTGSGTLRVRAGIRDRGVTNAILDAQYAEIAGTTSPRILRLSGFIDHAETEERLTWRIPGTKFTYLSVYGLESRNRDAIVDVFRSFRPQVVHGFPSAIQQLALLFRDSPLPSDIRSFVVVTVSETLTDDQRSDIETLLRTQVYDEYGSQEGQHLVVECAHRSRHIHPARGIVEILELDADVPAAAGTLGRVVVTGLVNRTMPLFRYDIGDTAISTGYAEGCACGCHWPTIGAIYGRVEDLVRTRDGRQFHLMSLKATPGVRESQVIQKGFERFVYRAVLDDASSVPREAIEASVIEQLRSRMQTDVEVEFEYVHCIERTVRGKFRAVIVDMDV